MKVRLTQEAKAALERIGDHIAMDNPGRTGNFVRELHAACAALGDTPQAFPPVPRYEGKGVRRRTHGNYLGVLPGGAGAGGGGGAQFLYSSVHSLG